MPSVPQAKYWYRVRLHDSRKEKFSLSLEYEIMQRGQYKKLGSLVATTPAQEPVPLELQEARNAVEIAKSQGAEMYAPEILSKAEGRLQTAEHLLRGKFDRTTLISTARQTTQFAEVTRLWRRSAKEKSASRRNRGCGSDSRGSGISQRAAEVSGPSEELTRMVNTWLI